MTLLLLMNVGFAGSGAAPVVTFNPAWAQGSNRTIGMEISPE